MKTFIIGDSHILHLWSHVIYQWLRGRTCYRFGKKNLKDYNLHLLIEQSGLTDGDLVIFSVGEIDCSCHVHKHVSKTRSYEDVIDDLIKNYFETVNLLVKDSGLKLYVYIYNVIPPLKKDNLTDANRPIIASKEDRLKFCKYFNKRAKQQCAENGFGFFDIYDKYADEEGYLIESLSDGYFHIINHEHIENFKSNNIKEEITSGKVKLINNKIQENQLKKLKNIAPGTYEEVFACNTYEKFCTVETGDTVLDLGCSYGFFYFKHKSKNIKYYAVDASSECIRDFYSILEEEDDPIVINAIVDNTRGVPLIKPFFHNTEDKLVASISFGNLMKLMPEKINFFKFDIEGAERFFLTDEKGYAIFKNKVEKFSGEIHFSEAILSRQEAYDIVKKIQNDPDISCKIYSCDGIDIGYYFWLDPDRYQQIIISGIVKKSN